MLAHDHICEKVWNGFDWAELKMPTEIEPRCSLLLITEQHMHNPELYQKNVSEEVLIHSTPSRAMVWVGAAKFQEVVRGMRTFTVQKAVDFLSWSLNLTAIPRDLTTNPMDLMVLPGV